jgi:hypothetical protein
MESRIRESLLLMQGQEERETTKEREGGAKLYRPQDNRNFQYFY